MLDPDACYAALEGRDPRFDGRFFVGVRSTGVYCRSVCPARTPRRDRVEFFPSAEAAAGAGFRACLRCRPETAPRTPAWQGSAATVARAVRLIDDGALDDGTVGDLADRLGIGERHLRGLFRQHLGASPMALAQGRRLRSARLILKNTDLPMVEVASLAGFSSVRRFNDAVLRGFGRSPTALRQTARGIGGGITVRLAYRPPYDHASLIRYLAARAIPGVEEIRDGVWRHGVAVDGRIGVVSVRLPEAGAPLSMQIPAELVRALPALVVRVRRAFDLDADPQAVAARLAPLDPEPGLRLPGAFDPFSVAVRVILGQQVSVKAASTLARRLLERIAPVGDDLAAFPAPEAVAEAHLEGIGLPASRARTIRVLATEVAEGRLTFGSGATLDALEAQLRALPGIGPWTASMLAMRAFGEPDAFPASDLVLRRVFPDAAAVAPYRPWRAYAALVAWNRHSEEDR